MIYDKLENLELYSCMGEKLQMAINYILMTDFTNMKHGRYELLKNEVYAIVNEYNTKPIEDVKWEAHRKFADIQYLIRGKERMGFTSIDRVVSTDPYIEEKDIEFFKGEGNYLEMSEGEICIFFPHDVHRPGINILQSQEVKKVVIKVLV